MAIVSTGQITIVDNNDARPLTAHIAATPGIQQVFTKDESAVAYTPDWQTGASLVLTARVYAGATGSAQDVTGLLSNRRWTFDLSTAVSGTAALVSSNAQMAAVFTSGAGHTFTTVHGAGGSAMTISANFLPTVSQTSIYFEGDYTDPVTGLVSHVVAQIGLSMVRTGTNAVHVLLEGTTAIEQATGAAKNVAVVAARLVRAAGIDHSGITYRWFENNGGTQIINTAPFTGKYGMKTHAVGVSPTGSLANIGNNLPAADAWASYNSLIIHESAVQDIGSYRVEAKDADGTVYQAYFQITDYSDPYETRILSSAGDKFQNGVGSTTFTPDVYYGATRIATLTGWSFHWTFYNRDGKRGAFVDQTRTAVSGGRTVTAHTTGNNAVITYSGTAITFAAGDLIKVVSASLEERFYEVASATGNTVTIRPPNVHSSWLTWVSWPNPAAGQFVDGRLFVCQGGTTQGKVTTSGAAGVIVTGDDIDAKGNILCEADRP